jgi:hypothetical protein
VITISNSTPNTQPSNTNDFSIDDPYICGGPIQGRVFSNNLANLDKVYLILESTTNPNLTYTINPNINRDGTYQFGTVNIAKGSYKITYYAIAIDGTQTSKKSYFVDIKTRENCTIPISQIQPNTDRQSGVLDYVFSPIKLDKISTETLTKIAQLNQPQIAENVSNGVSSLVRTGGEKIQSTGVLILILIDMAHTLARRIKK